MTRGFIVISEGRTIKGAAYIPSDAYPAGEAAKDIEQAFSQENLKEAMQELIKRYKAEEVDAPSIGIGTMKDMKSPLWDYVYELHNGETLNVYDNGEKALSFEKKDLPYLHFLNNECGDCANNLWEHLAYDPDSMSYAKNDLKEFQKFMEAGKPLEEIRAIVGKPVEYVTVDQNPHIVALGLGIAATHHAEDGKKTSMMFCFYPKDKMNPYHSKYESVALQLPDTRHTVEGVFSRNTAYTIQGARKKLVEFLKRQPDFVPKAAKYISCAKELDAKVRENKKRGLPLEKGIDKILKAHPDAAIFEYTTEHLRQRMYDKITSMKEDSRKGNSR